jgi:hypothetical protein
MMWLWTVIPGGQFENEVNLTFGFIHSIDGDGHIPGFLQTICRGAYDLTSTCAPIHSDA